MPIEALIQRALFISKTIGAKQDLRLARKIASYSTPLDFAGDLEALGITGHAWLHVRQLRIDPKMVFAHPNLLKDHPDASMYYRGIATLSLKQVAQEACNVDAWETKAPKARVTLDRARKVCHLYNRVTSSVLEALPNWELNDGHRNILATMGIRIDGSLRNLIGQNAERNIRSMVVNWLSSESNLSCKQTGRGDTEWLLGEDQSVRLNFSSEPDIGFYQRVTRNGTEDWELVASIEIKGGTDPAGALERLGAIKKSFDNTPVRCKNFLVLGVVTNEMRRQMDQMRIDGTFLLSEVLEAGDRQDEFLSEVFHHTLRLLDKPFRHSSRVLVDRFGDE